MIGRTARHFVLAATAAFGLTAAVPVAAQDAETGARVKKLEAEVRALQRKVFPGGDGKFFEPEITAQPATGTAQAVPASSALTDVLARLDALESQLQRLTAQYEEGANQVRLLTGRVAALEAAGVPASATGADTAPPNASPSPAAVVPAEVTPAPAATRPAPRPAAGPDAARLAAVQAILKPQTDDPGDDEYSYGYRLWDAKLFPEAQQQLTMFLDKYPRHSRVSYARNLLGRAYLDDGNPKDAAPWFLKNYQADKMGERAGDSLLFLAESMIALKDTKRACIALAEFSEAYPALAAGRLTSQYEANRARVKCN